MSINVRSAANVSPSVVASGFIPLVGAAPVYQPPVGGGAQIVCGVIKNTDSSAQTVTLSIVRTGDSGAISNLANQVVCTESIAAKGSMTFAEIFGGEVVLGDGDFIWAQAGAANKVNITVTAYEYDDDAGAVMSGVQPDFVGSGASGLSGSLTPESCKISALPNRRLITNLLVQQGSTSFGWASYTGGGPTVMCSDGPMTRKGSIDIVNAGGTIVGSVHQFNFDNPTSGSTQAITPAAAAAGATMNLITSSKSYSGVDLAAALSVVTNNSQTAALSLPFTGMAAGVVPVMAAGFVAGIPLKYNMDAIRLYGMPSGFAIAQYLLAADKFGVPALTAIDTNATNPYAAVGQVLHPA